MKPAFEHRINRAFDRCASPGFSIGSRFVLWFQVWASLGLTLATGAALSLAVLSRFSLASMAAAVLAAGTACFLLALGYKVITGEERLVFLHHAIAAIGAAALTLHIAGRPILPYAEILVVCFGVLLSVGRLGCLCAGCCHGRPCSWGMRYGERHVEEGFAPSLSGVRLVPVQLLESVWVGTAALACLAPIVNGAPTGLALAAFLPLYGAGRFGCEFLRGDDARRWWGPLSEAQWICIGLAAASLLTQVGGALPTTPLSFSLACAGLAVMLCALAWHGLRERLQPFHPRELNAIAGAVRVDDDSQRMAVRSTGRGWKFSRGAIESELGSCIHWAISGFPGEPRRLDSLARLLLRLEGLPRDTPIEIRSDRPVTHILAFPPRKTDS